MFNPSYSEIMPLQFLCQNVSKSIKIKSKKNAKLTCLAFLSSISFYSVASGFPVSEGVKSSALSSTCSRISD